MKPIVFAGSLVEKILGHFFLPGAIRSSKEREHVFALEIQQELGFLFEDNGGTIVPDEGLKYPQPFDCAFVLVALDEDLIFRFFRGLEDLRVWVAPKRTPKDWAELQIVFALLQEPDEERPFLLLKDVAYALKPRLGRLREAFSPDRYSELKRRLADRRDFEGAVIRQRENQINRNLYG